jgi:hypothetical protein
VARFLILFHVKSFGVVSPGRRSCGWRRNSSESSSSHIGARHWAGWRGLVVRSVSVALWRKRSGKPRSVSATGTGGQRSLVLKSRLEPI